MEERASLFIVVEGLDGSGKTSVARQLANVLDHASRGTVKLTFEPHDPSCNGLFIRQVLMKKIRNFSPRILPLAFATNRLDHCDREINPWLEGGKNRVVVCDRYYLSSLVYQSSPDFPYQAVLALNEKARKPDLIFFLDVSDKVCYERMKIRNQPKELFEKSLSNSRKKYLEAIEVLRTQNNDNIVEIDGSGTISEVVEAMLSEIYARFPDWKPQQPIISADLVGAHIFTLNGGIEYTTDDFIKKMTLQKQATKKPISEINLEEISALINALSFDQRGSLFLEHIKRMGYTLGEKMPWTHLDCYELEYIIPPKIQQRGTALLINETQRYDIILQTAPQLYEMADFMFVFAPGPAEAVNEYYERDRIQYANKNNEVAYRLAPFVQLVTEKDLAEAIFVLIVEETPA